MLISLQRRIAGSLRIKMLALVMFPILLVIPAVLYVAVRWNESALNQQLLLKVNTDLSVAHAAFEQIQRDYLVRASQLGQSFDFRTSLERGDNEKLRQLLQRLKNKEHFTYLTVWTPDGKPMIADGPVSPLKTPLWEDARSGKGAVGIEVRGPADLKHVSYNLPDRVRLPLVDTPRANSTWRRVEQRGMWIRVLFPVERENGHVRAIIDGAVLLNDNFEFVDAIRDLVYGPGSLPEKGLGTVTVFLDDVRISTNVPIRPGERALGTRVSNEVREEVLEEGNTWVKRAFVVNDWYISAYEPITDVSGARVGMLYAGFLESPYVQEQMSALEDLFIIFFVIIAISIYLAIHGARNVFKPIERMTAVARATQKGENVRIGEVNSSDEIGELAQQFDEMLDLLQERNSEIRHSAQVLEKKVKHRTRELTEKNFHLERTIALLKKTREQLVTKEKLAALGELTAGIAHEINNPTAVILGNMDLIRAELGRHADPIDTEIELIVEQVYRIRGIINNLLQYSRPGSVSISAQAVYVNAAMDDTLVLVRHALDKKRIGVRKVLRASRPIQINHQQLQHVLVNLIVNAVNAMEEGGLLTIGTVDWYDQGAMVYVQDTGCGIQKSDIDNIFDPFFTTRQQGTGLGLSVSYGIVRRYGGHISVRSRPGRGTIFYVWLLNEPEYDEDEDELLANIV